MLLVLPNTVGMISSVDRRVGEILTCTIVGVKATSEEVKTALKANTDEALQSGSFGLPWFVATDTMGRTEVFFGFDHIGQVVAHLGLERPQQKGEDGGAEGWRAML